MFARAESWMTLPPPQEFQLHSALQHGSKDSTSTMNNDVINSNERRQSLEVNNAFLILFHN